MSDLFTEVFANSWWSKQGDFPPCDDWKENIERHLEFMQDKGWLASIKSQLQSRNYEAFLSEIFAAYFIENNLEFEVRKWNPSTIKDRDVEFTVNDKAGGDIYCEVKGPGWPGQLSSDEIRSGRAKRRKYPTSPEARYTAPYKNIRRSIDKSYEKFLSDKQNLLIIADNLFRPLSMDPRFNSEMGRKIPWDIYVALYNDQDELYGGKGYFQTDKHKNLGGVLFLNDRYLGKFFAWFEINPNARIPLIDEFVSKAFKLIDKLIKKSESH